MEFLEARTNAPPSTLVFVKRPAPVELDFHERLVAFRKKRRLTQQSLSEMVGTHVSQIRCYEIGQSQPTSMPSASSQSRSAASSCAMKRAAAPPLIPEVHDDRCSRTSAPAN